MTIGYASFRVFLFFFVFISGIMAGKNMQQAASHGSGQLAEDADTFLGMTKILFYISFFIFTVVVLCNVF